MSQDLLLNVRQAIPENLGSNQIIGTLDHFLYKALQGVLRFNSKFVDCRVAHLMHQMGRDETRRSYSVDHSNVVTHARLMEYFCRGADKLNQVRLAALDRIFLIDWLDKFTSVVKKMVVPMPTRFDKKPDVPASCYAAASSENMADKIWLARPMLAAVQPHFEAGIGFRAWIMQKYYRFIYKHVLGMAKSTGMQVDRNDLYQNTLLVSIKTINKYSSNKGTLTEFILLWLRSAYALKFDHAVGQSYLLPVGKRNRMSDTEWVDKGVARSNVAYDLEDAEHVQADIDGQSSENDAELVREQNALLSTTMDACSADIQVRQFFNYAITPHIQRPKINSIELVSDIILGAVTDLKSAHQSLVESIPVIELDDDHDASLIIFAGDFKTSIPCSKPTHSPSSVELDKLLDSVTADPGSEEVELESVMRNSRFSNKTRVPVKTVARKPATIETPNLNTSVNISHIRQPRPDLKKKVLVLRRAG